MSAHRSERDRADGSRPTGTQPASTTLGPMCGRFVSASSPDEIARYFDAAAPDHSLEPNYNVAPTTDVYAVHETGGVRRVDAFHWGLVPSWAKDPSVGNRMINARAETVATKNAFRAALRRRRCLIPVDGFYEWRAIEGQRRKQPYYVHHVDGEPLAFAGLWERWRPAGDHTDVLHSCTIITTGANDDMAPIHDRMPVILGADHWAEWLDETNDDVATLGQLLVPAPPALLQIQPVSTEVNNVRNKGPHLIEPAPLDDTTAVTLPGHDADPARPA
jgi:putative SOS response-associated peptidase YedK